MWRAPAGQDDFLVDHHWPVIKTLDDGSDFDFHSCSSLYKAGRRGTRQDERGVRAGVFIVGAKGLEPLEFSV